MEIFALSIIRMSQTAGLDRRSRNLREWLSALIHLSEPFAEALSQAFRQAVHRAGKLGRGAWRRARSQPGAPYPSDRILYYVYVQGDSGAGIGASHQACWTGLATKLLEQNGE